MERKEYQKTRKYYTEDTENIKDKLFLLYLLLSIQENFMNTRFAQHTAACLHFFPFTDKRTRPLEPSMEEISSMNKTSDPNLIVSH
jgi:hypothetical protein